MLNSMFSSFRTNNTVTGEKRGRLSENPEAVATDILQTPPKKRAKPTRSEQRQEVIGELSPLEVVGGWIRRAMNWANRYNISHRNSAWQYVVGKKKEDVKTVIMLDDEKEKQLTVNQRREYPEVVVIDDEPSQEQRVILTKEVIVLDADEPKKSLQELSSRRDQHSIAESSTPLRPPDGFHRGHKPVLSLTQDSHIRTKNPHAIVRHENLKESKSSLPIYHRAPNTSKLTINEESSNVHSPFTVGKHSPYSGKVRVRPTKESLRKSSFSRSYKSTAREVIRLQEKERYRQLLSQYMESSTLDQSHDRELQPSFRCDLTEDVSISTKPTISQRKVVRQSEQTTFSPRSSLLPSSVSPVKHPSSVIQPTVYKVQPSLERTHIAHQHVEDLQPIYSTTSSQSPKVSDSENRTMETRPEDSLLSEEWTRKWRNLLSEDNLSRERQKAKIQREEKRLEELKAKRKEEQHDAIEEVKARLHHVEGGESEEEEDAEEFVVLTDEMEREIDRALAPGNPSETLVDGGKVSVTRGDMVTLSNLNWLNDEVINFYISLITERSKSPGYPKVHSFNSFFYPKLIKTGFDSLKRWTRRVDIFTFDLILVPIHLGMHWCLAAIDFRKKTIKYYDSLKGSNTQCLEALKKYLSQESMDKKKTPYDTSNWTLSCPKDIPEQLNGCDCGVFACKYAEYISRDTKFTFDQRNMPYFRRRMVYEILKMKLL